MVEKRKIRVGFGSVSMDSILVKTENHLDDILTQTIYLSDGEQEVAWIMQDCYNWNVESTTFLREVIGRRTGIDPARIVISTSENHSHHGLGSTISRPQAEIYAVPMAESVAQAREKARPAHMAAVIADVGLKFSIRRRKYINDDLGVLSFWSSFTLRDGKADATELVRGVVAALCCKYPTTPHRKITKYPELIRDYDAPELHEPIYYDDPVDNLVHLLVFRDEAGETLGSIIRFSAHVQGGPPGARTAGYPGYARRLLEKEVGGTAAFILGPQGDLVPRVDISEEGTVEELRRIGEGIAGAALDALRKEDPEYKPVERIAFARAVANVPLREDYPKSPEDAEKKMITANKELEKAVADRAPIRRIKELVECVKRLTSAPRFFSRTGLTVEQAREGCWPVAVEALAINHVTLAGLVAETGCLTTKALREEFDDWVLPISESNGCINYIMTDGDQQNGGYEAYHSCVSPMADSVLRAALGQAIREVRHAVD